MTWKPAKYLYTLNTLRVPVSKVMRGVKNPAPTQNDGDFKYNGPQSRAALKWAEGAKNLLLECRYRERKKKGRYY